MPLLAVVGFAMCAAFSNVQGNAPIAKHPQDDFPSQQPRWKTGFYYDASTHLAARIQAVPDSNGTITVYAARVRPSNAHPMTLRSWQLQSGIHVGSSAGDLLRAEGKAFVIRGCAQELWRYTVDPEVVNSLEFVLQDGRVIAITRTWGD